MIFKKKVAGLTQASLSRFLVRARRSVGLGRGVNLLLTGSGEMRSLNSRFRGKNKPTDVLSFPAPSEGLLAGEIAISTEIAARNAARLGHSTALEIKVLALHGLLHLAGFDHERDNGRMARKEAHIRQELRLPTTLIERSLASEKGALRLGLPRLKRARRTA